MIPVAILLFSLLLTTFLGFQQNAHAAALACPTTGTVRVNTTWGPINADDYYDCSAVDITINSGVTLTLAGNTSSGSGVGIRAQNLTITGTVTANNKGYQGVSVADGVGPGKGKYIGTSGGSAGHGGTGYITGAYGGTYGSALQPVTIGSSGGGGYYPASPPSAGGPGGGAIQLSVSGTLTLNGTLSANGGTGTTNTRSGGGSGGSIWIDAATFEGAGVLQANGGNGASYSGTAGYGGGGGRIAVYYQTNTYTGSITTTGGTGYAAGGIGSIVQVVAGILHCSKGAFTLTSAEVGALNQIMIDSGCNITTSGDFVFSGDISIGPTSAASLTVGATLSAHAITLNSGSSMTLNSALTTSGAVTIAGNSTVIANSNLVSGTGVTVQAESLSLEAGSTLTANNKGYQGVSVADGVGPGKGKYIGTSGGSAGHGGTGYVTGDYGGTYGSALQPVTIGSSGGGGYYPASPPSAGGPGGGAIQLSVSGTLTLNGTLSANGGTGTTNTRSGGGSGGSIWIDAATFEGAGVLQANGGNGASYSGTAGYGGGGVRIAVYYQTNTYTGSITTTGGTGYAAGGTGSIVQVAAGILHCSKGSFTLTSAEVGALNQIMIDSGCNITTSGDFVFNGDISIGPTSAASLTVGATLSAHTITLNSGSSMTLNSALTTSGAVTIAGNSTVIANSNLVSGTGVTVQAESLSLEAGSTLTANNKGYQGVNVADGVGPGKGKYVNGGSGGSAGHGGTGYVTGAYGGTYGSALQPVTIGSSGGGGYYPFTPPSVGGPGGGAIQLSVSGTLTLNGTLSVNGGTGTTNTRAGGGSGGSIWIDAATLEGTGSLQANGGNGATYSGSGYGGGGGRIAVYYRTNAYTGSITATGGTGCTAGGNGTIYVARSGTYISPVLDFSSSTLEFQTLNFITTTPGSTAVTLDIRGGNTSSPDGTWTSWTNIANGGSLAVFIGNRYLQYRATLSTANANKPSLDSITVNAPACYNTGAAYYVTTVPASQFKFARSNTATNFTITQNSPANTALKVLVSFDGGTTWKKHNGTGWVEAVGGVSTIGTTGNTPQELTRGISNYTFQSTEPTVDFAFGLQTDSCSATPSITELMFDY